ncbi:MAG: sigma-70 family RNA polymerase sigma factor [Caldilineales bacterium]|nr:sigma-70 family RNA polymerase sigma factor [Caldilineales bacterium]
MSGPNLPPPSDRLWSPDEQNNLYELIREIIESVPEVRDISEAETQWITRKLASQKAVRRYQRAEAYARQQNAALLSYSAWIQKVVIGYHMYHPLIASAVETDEGPRPALQQLLDQTVYRNYQKLYGRYPTPDERELVVGRVFLGLSENYFYDTPLAAWIWRSTRNILLGDIRDPFSGNTQSFDEVQPAKTPISTGEFSQHYVQREAVLGAIKQVRNQRYRVILLLQYTYELDNSELAAFFGVEVARATVWVFRARRAFRNIYSADGNN